MRPPESCQSALQIVPLGGCGEVGLNSTLLVSGRQAILIDCGVLLKEVEPGVSQWVPGFEPILEAQLDLQGVVLTHGHQDHIGALPSLLFERDVPVFGTTLAIALARARMERHGAAKEARNQASRFFEVRFGERVRLGAFEVEWIRVTHSLPESAALHVECPAGRLLHSGDFRLDATPVSGPPTDVGRFSALSEQGVDVLLSDSTNAESPGRGRSEQEVRTQLERVVLETEGRALVTCIASHLHRTQSILDAAQRAGRRVCLLGRSIRGMVELGVAQGHLRYDAGLLVDERAAIALRRRELLVLASGAQGERGGAFARMAAGRDAGLRCLPGDRVIYSSRVIPGSELRVREVLNNLARQGAEVLQDRMAAVHCSGHAHGDELRELIELVRPRHFVPVHGERVMLERHAALARSAGVSAERVFVIEDGQSVVLEGGVLRRGPEHRISRRPIDAEGRMVDWGDLRARRRLARGGLAACSVVFSDGEGRLVAPPAVTFRGASVPARLGERVAAAVARALADAPEETRRDTEACRAMVERVMQAALKHQLYPLPDFLVHILTVGSGPAGSGGNAGPVGPAGNAGNVGSGARDLLAGDPTRSERPSRRLSPEAAAVKPSSEGSP